MGIYSRNRSGSMSASQIACNENYGPSDIGKIMYESVVNDNSIFEAIIMSDLTESKCLREGTLLEAEAKKFSKENVMKILEAIKERLKKFWEKIKGAIQTAIRKLSAYILRDGKAFVKDFRIATKDKKFTDSVKDIVLYDVGDDSGFNIAKYESEIRSRKNDENFDKAAILNKLLSDSCGKEVTTTKEFRAAILEKDAIKADITASDINRLCSIIEDASISIKNIKEFEKRNTKGLNKVGDAIKAAEKDLAKNDDSIDHGKIIKNITALVSIFETYISTTCSICIFEVKENVKTARVTLGKIKHKMEDIKHEAAFIESAAIVDAEDVDAAMTSDEPIDPEVDKEIEKIEVEA